MVEIVTIGWLTLDDILLTDCTYKKDVQGGGALYSAIGAYIWNIGVGVQSVAGKPYFVETCRLIEERGIDSSGINQVEGNGLELWILHESEIHKQQVPKLSSSKAPDLDRERGPLSGLYMQARGFHIAPQCPESSLANAKRLGTLPADPIVTMDILSDNFIDSSLYRNLDFLTHLTAFLPSQAEIERIWRPVTIESWLRENALQYECHMVAKLGERGSLVCDASTGKLFHVPALISAVRDTTGAGDSFCGGFIAGLVAGKSPVTCAAMATVSASYVVESCGALATEQPTTEQRRLRLEATQAAVRPIEW